MGWKDWSYTKKGALIGFVFGLISVGLFFVGIPLAILPMYILYVFQFIFGDLSYLEGFLLLGWIFVFLAPINYLIIGVIVGWLIDIKSGNKLIKPMPLIYYWFIGGLIGVLINFIYISNWRIINRLPSFIGDILYFISFFIGFRFLYFIWDNDLFLRIVSLIGFFIFGVIISLIIKKIKFKNKK